MAIHKSSPWTRACVFDPATGDRVEFECVDELTAYEPENVLTDLSAFKVQSKKQRVIKLGGFDWFGYDLLEQWKADNTLLNAVALGEDGNLQMYENLPIADLNEDIKVNRRSAGTAWQVVFEGIGRTLNIHNNQNLLAYLGWNDSDNNGIADGYESEGAQSTFAFLSQPARQQIIANNAGANIYTHVVFPLSGARLTLSNYFTVASQQYRLILQGFSFFGAQLNSSNQLYSIPDLRSIQNVAPSGIYTFRVQISTAVQAAGNSVISRNPALTTNGKVTSPDLFMNY